MEIIISLVIYYIVIHFLIIRKNSFFKRTETKILIFIALTTYVLTTLFLFITKRSDKPNISEGHQKSPNVAPGPTVIIRKDNSTVGSIDTTPAFQWPPPRPSASLVLHKGYIFHKWPGLSEKTCRFCADLEQPLNIFECYFRHELTWDDIVFTLSDLDQALRSSLSTTGHLEYSYFQIPMGFALVTRLEQINEDGTAKPHPPRWVMHSRAMRKFSIKNYLSALFLANPGLYRVAVFTVTPETFTPDEESISRETAKGWLTSGVNFLPDSIGSLPLTNDYRCTVLIYEFSKSDVQKEASTNLPSQIPAQNHIFGTTNIEL